MAVTTKQGPEGDAEITKAFEGRAFHPSRAACKGPEAELCGACSQAKQGLMGRPK